MTFSNHIRCCFIISLMLTVVNGITDQNSPTISEIWIYLSVVLGCIGCLVGLFIIITGARDTQLMVNSNDMPKILIILIFSIWILNFIACAEWAFLRTNLFINLTKQRCIAIYITNYVCYLAAKHCMHTVFLYGLYLILEHTPFEINGRFIKSMIILITIFFIAFLIIFIPICVHNVTIGVGAHSDELQMCTLYNSESNSQLSTYDKIWPIVNGLTVAVILVGIFVKKMREFSSTKRLKHDIQTEGLIRKICTLAALAICSTFIFYTFAVPFYPNFTFLLPLDAALNSLCIMLLIDYSAPLYICLCCFPDLCLRKTLGHHRADDSIVKIVGTYRNSKLSTSQISEDFRPKSRIPYDSCEPDTDCDDVHVDEDITNQSNRYARHVELKVAPNTNTTPIYDIKEETDLDLTIAEETEYQQWDWQQIASWIISLDTDKYADYESVLRERLKSEDVKGHQLCKVDKNDLHRFGVVDFGHKIEVMRHIEILTKT